MTVWKASLPILLAAGMVWPASPQANEALPSASKPRPMMAQGYYAREPQDRAWQVKITGRIPSLCGAYLMILGTGNKMLYKGRVPTGEYSEEKPFVVPFKPDGITGDYKIEILGQQNDYLGINLPLTDLPFETYSGEWLSIANDTNTLLAFRVPAGTKKAALKAYQGNLQVYDDKKQFVADSKAGISVMMPDDTNKNFYHKRDSPIEFPVEVGKTYWLRTMTMYFTPREKMFFAFDPARIFEPDPTLENVPWWELID